MELTFYLQGAYWFRLRYGFDEIISGLIVMIWSSMNLAARPYGGYFSDKYDIQKQVYVLACILVLEGIYTLIFGLSLAYNDYSYSLTFTVFIMLLFSWTIQMAEGIVFSIVPFINSNTNCSNHEKAKTKGHVMGIVSSGGNFGAMLFVFLIFIPFTIRYSDSNVSNNDINSSSIISNPWIILGIIIMICSTLPIFIRFTQKEIQRNNRLRANNTFMYDIA